MRKFIFTCKIYVFGLINLTLSIKSKIAVESSIATTYSCIHDKFLMIWMRNKILTTFSPKEASLFSAAIQNCPSSRHERTVNTDHIS